MTERNFDDTLEERLSRLRRQYEQRQRQLTFEYQSAVRRESENSQRAQKQIAEHARGSAARALIEAKEPK